MLKALKTRIAQGKQFVPDVRNANPRGFRGLPVVSSAPCETGCAGCAESCPTQAIRLDPVQIDLGRCVFCNECAIVCPARKVVFTTGYKMASDTREGLLVGEGIKELHVRTSETFRKLFGRSLKLRSVSAGGCNGCELEINAMVNVNFDATRFGIEYVASPRHADGLVLSGPITRNMAEALALSYEGMPDPKFVIAAGACAISGGLYDGAPGVDRAFLGRFAPQLYVPGCPPHPLSLVNGILELLGRK